MFDMVWRGTLEERLVRQIAWPANFFACWEWAGVINYDGYGRIKAEGRYRVVHRVSYELARGPVPSEMQLDHLCRNRRCVNPLHLEPVTGRTNLRRAPSQITTINAQKTACPAGHEYNVANTYRTKKGKRMCRRCAASRLAEKRRAGKTNNTDLTGEIHG